MDLDRERLIRLLGMTDSDQDAEALTAVRMSNALLRAQGLTWKDVIDPSGTVQQDGGDPAEEPYFNEDWSMGPRPGYEPSRRIRDALRAEFPITLAFFPLWLVAELMAVIFPNVHWNKNGPRTSPVFWTLCWLGLLAWVGAVGFLLFALS